MTFLELTTPAQGRTWRWYVSCLIVCMFTYWSNVGLMYTVFAIIQVISGLLVLLVRAKGEKWRNRAEAREAREALAAM